MEKTSSPFIIDSILSEVSLDDRIDDGIVNLKNTDHVIVVVEKMYQAGVSLELLEGFIKKHIATEGKYPERQAYNKEGWLVTFPSSEYKNAAIKKGTHFGSDPTHGKGGMNVYYKRKGKQKRVGSQEPSQRDVNQDQQPRSAPAPTTTQRPTPPPANGSDAQSTDGGHSVSEPTTDKNVSPAASTSPVEEPEAANGAEDSTLSPSDSSEKGGSKSVPSVTATPNSSTNAPISSNVNISVEFARSKQWNPTPYGEWRNITGDTTAVVGLSGEVVPIKSTDREELKLFATKK